MRSYENWSPYAGSGSIILAVVLFLIVGVLLFGAFRLQRSIQVKRPGAFMGVTIIVIWILSVLTFLIAVTAYALELYKQVGPYTGPKDPITPVTMGSAVLTFFVIIALAQHSGFRVAVGSAIVGTIAAPMIFELPFDLIVMWHTFPPAPAALFTPLFFYPLFLVEVSSFAMLMLSPVMRLSRYTLFFLASMFLVFAVWALFGFAYPAWPLPIVMNMLAKVLAFATAVTLFLPQRKERKEEVVDAATPVEAQVHA